MNRTIFAQFGLLVGAALVLAPLAGGAAEPYEAIAVSAGGRIRGTVEWEGSRPQVAAMAINKNVEICDTDETGKRTSPRVEISSSGGVSNAVVYLDDISQGKAMEVQELVLDQRGCRYVPHITIAPKRSTITLKSSDEILHNIHMFGAASYNLPFPDKNSVEKSLRRSGVIRLQCDAGHGWMSAYIHVVNHPYYAVTDVEGRFELSDVPAGTYTIKMWHESWVVANEITKEGEVVGYEFAEPISVSQTVEVTAGGESSVQFSLSE